MVAPCHALPSHPCMQPGALVHYNQQVDTRNSCISTAESYNYDVYIVRTKQVSPSARSSLVMICWLGRAFPDSYSTITFTFSFTLYTFACARACAYICTHMCIQMYMYVYVVGNGNGRESKALFVAVSNNLITM